MTLNYDKVAESWVDTLSPLPDEYIRLLKTELQLRHNSYIIDLGCGSGLLTFRLAEISNSVNGLDASQKMLDIARKANSSEDIIWIHSPVDRFYFGNDHYDVIIGFESMHHFFASQTAEVWLNALKNKGFLAMGYSIYSWEDAFKDAIVDYFKQLGIDWGDWYYYQCPQFLEVVSRLGDSFSEIRNKTITIPQRYSARSIAKLIVSIDKAINLDMEARRNAVEYLVNAFKSLMGGEFFDGYRSYTLYYAQKELSD